MLRKLLAGVAGLGLVLTGCYNTYDISMDDLAKLQEGGRSNAVKLATSQGEEVVVTENSKIGVTLKDGEFVPVSPFNFTLAGNQLVAPDEDRLVSTTEIQTANVKEVSGMKTGLLVAAGVAAIVGAGLFITLTAPERKSFGE
jgi:hypothetical protein